MKNALLCPRDRECVEDGRIVKTKKTCLDLLVGNFNVGLRAILPSLSFVLDDLHLFPCVLEELLPSLSTDLLLIS